MRNNKLYSKMLQDIEDEETIYYMSKTYDTKIKNLERALLNPYFARIEFKAEDENKVEKIYIGKTNVFDEDSNIVVADWRAPISSIYYMESWERQNIYAQMVLLKEDYT